MIPTQAEATHPHHTAPHRRLGLSDPGRHRAVAIVGAGFSGTMTAIHLRRVLPQDCVVYLFNRTGRFARGPAYAETGVPHLLNVRSGNMSALPDDPGHFERRLSDQAAAWPNEVSITPAGTFATRRLYGRYLRALLHEEMTLSGGRVRLCADEVVSLDRVAGSYVLECVSGREVNVSAVVLATGNLPSSRANDDVLINDPWTPDATADLRPNEPVLIVGTGLTMVDVALTMSRSGFAGEIIALSRRGLIPVQHGEPRPAVPCSEFSSAESRSLTTLLQCVRRRIRHAASEGQDWRAVIDGLRPVTSALWYGLPAAERSRFLRHLRPFWDVHRHRLAPSPAKAFAGLVASGALLLRRGRVQAIELQVGIHGRVARVTLQECGAATATSIEVQRVIYATGVGCSANSDGLIDNLIGGGFARPDQHGLGVDVTPAFQLVGCGGETNEAIWALGPIVRGVFWESTAVPDIRVQARDVANEVARFLAKPEMSGESNIAQLASL